MSGRQDLTVHLNPPRSWTDRTAQGILDALHGGQWVLVQDVDYAISAAGGDVRCKTNAVKALRNMGHPIASHKARHLSRYRLYADSADMEQWRVRVLEETYSTYVSTVRSLAGALSANPGDPMIATVHSAAEMTAIQVGRQLGKSFTVIIADLQPI